MKTKTFWNGEPCQARQVRVVVADSPDVPKYWARPLVGQERNAVEVVYAGQIFYLDDEAHEAESITRTILGQTYTFEMAAGYDGWAWDKVTHGGGPNLGHRSLTIERIVATRL